MKRSLFALATAAALCVAGAAHAAEPVYGTLSGTSKSVKTVFEVDYAGTLYGNLSSYLIDGVGYDIFSVVVDGVTLVDELPASPNDFYSFALPVLPGEHTIWVKGASFGGQFSGTYTVTPVPEPESLALAMTGLVGVAGALGRRRLKR
ncbi:PEP-CTERM sorting domain-containing protein [Aquabacterium olei]|nr:PEP-CTERM sorting domain-containing protein [Aquabacterium olei]